MVRTGITGYVGGRCEHCIVGSACYWKSYESVHSVRRPLVQHDVQGGPMVHSYLCTDRHKATSQLQPGDAGVVRGVHAVYDTHEGDVCEQVVVKVLSVDSVKNTTSELVWLDGAAATLPPSL